ncbi:phenylalanine--tRNA ligase subunit alpha [Thermosulfuriphilus ammonigenes]|uniref:Phenylalanine--tRNA ligase alpha subunit n=1 Tax=Thermosulfuriphilus ammonigenes TaxID=1936021 RepID=A0A6G7PY22_9BACT|nr:phenylalanine--tRNA ligase subunit alpha [Thermosulfuriphilus ammonigenes]MBA2849345.1 phenylalanyl-tRNA synthetase alpha chain [Thermosulfuriphilus ammonigenes]QIJ72421.1 phenylalanine--tRNA ligase subunit alpha [Thermosulfuriphilus ammonigenes]HFB83824.1 phenylalanine--tRNA ligase subunit alpha [Thermodesulfatator sp.]
MEEERLKSLRAEALAELAKAQTSQEVEAVRIKYLGRKGLLTGILKGVKELPAELRPIVGRLANEIKRELESRIKDRLSDLKEKEASIGPGLDITLPGRPWPIGHLHPITQVMEEICEVFVRLGFSIERGPEVELDYYNFEALNIPKDHPARDMQATFYISESVLLRTHTSPIQIRAMERRRPPLRIIAPGKVYRCDSDVTHTPMFHQVEGLMVDREVSFADLKGVLTYFVHQIFGPQTGVRFRPSFFPFTEPSAEIDIQCVMCGGKGCRVCGHTGWLEVLGAGMVHPNVFASVGYDSEEWTGFAFGLGVERIAMLKYGIDDIRLFFENNWRFLEQF